PAHSKASHRSATSHRSVVITPRSRPAWRLRAYRLLRGTVRSKRREGTVSFKRPQDRTTARAPAGTDVPAGAMRLRAAGRRRLVLVPKPTDTFAARATGMPLARGCP